VLPIHLGRRELMVNIFEKCGVIDAFVDAATVELSR
jgi:hypothetical protein